MKFTIKEIRFKDYKSFKGDYISLKPEKFTLLIGRNNCGKSSIIDVFESITFHILANIFLLMCRLLIKNFIVNMSQLST